MTEQLGLLEQTLEDVILDLAEGCGGIKGYPANPVGTKPNCP